jgi:D-3-phosphoglycerate dehydrogenase
MLPDLERFRQVFAHYQVDLIVPEVHERLSEDEILHYAGQFDGAVCGDDRFTRRVIEACSPRLKVISKWGTGIDSIDRQAAGEMGVQVCNTANAFTLPVADTVMAYVLAFVRRIPWSDREVKAGRWEKLPGRALSECTLGVVGVGHVGKAVLRRARAFGARLLGNDVIEIGPDFVTENGVEMVSLPELLGRSDFISLNCDLNPSSRHLIDADTLALVKRGAVLINTSRGPVVDESALIAALQSGRLAGAALDVYEDEPLPAASPLLSMDNVMLAPHNSNSSPTAWERVHRNTLHNLFTVLGIAHTDLDVVMNPVKTKELR